MSILDILKQYASPGTAPTGDVYGHFDSVAQQSNPSALGSAVTAALHSDATPAFGETVAKLFGQSNPAQKAGVLNEMMQALGPATLAGAGGGLLSKILGGSTQPISPAQASQISPTDLNAIATSAQQQDASIVGKLGNFYAQHPALVKTLGVAALGVVMSHMSAQQHA